MDAIAGAGLAASVSAGEGEGGTPRLELDGFSGPLDLLLTLARAREVDLAQLSVVDLVDQLASALKQADIPLSQKADWVVMASWLLLLRSRLALPADALAREDAADNAEALRGQLIELRAAQALAHWLDRRPQLGRDVFVRGQPELLGTSIDARYEVDVIEFLWACLVASRACAPAARARRRSARHGRRPPGPRSQGAATSGISCPYTRYWTEGGDGQAYVSYDPRHHQEPKNPCSASETSVRVAARAMADRNVGSVMVVEGGKLVGIFTERDALVRVLAAGRDPATTQLSVVMVRKVLTISPDRSLVNALHRMRDNGFRHMPVVENGVPIGMVSVRDALASDLVQLETEEEVKEELTQVMR
jgi:predicted transcriptional regulator